MAKLLPAFLDPLRLTGSSPLPAPVVGACGTEDPLAEAWPTATPFPRRFEEHGLKLPPYGCGQLGLFADGAACARTAVIFSSLLRHLNRPLFTHVPPSPAEMTSHGLPFPISSSRYSALAGALAAYRNRFRIPCPVPSDILRTV